jgi:hypothetical protein
MSKNRLFYHCVKEGVLVDGCFQHKDLDRPIDRRTALKRLEVLNGLTERQAKDLLKAQEDYARKCKSKS